MNLTTVVNPIVAFNILEYLTALEVILNLHSKLDRLQKFSHKAMETLRHEYGVPEPLDKVVFAVISVISMIIVQKIIKKLFKKSNVDSSKFKFNLPDFSEVGIIANQIKKINEELHDIKKHISKGGSSI